MLIQVPTMSEPERVQFSEFIEREYGIKMPPSKKVLLESRLSRRLKALNMDNFTAYYCYLMSERGLKSELFSFIDLISTHKTEFFREPKHYDFLMNIILPEFVKENKRNNKEIRIWSAACSTGQEPYSITMATEEYLNKTGSGDTFYSVLATDLSTEVLEKAYRAVYTEETICTIPESFKKKYLLRSKDRSAGKFRINRELRSKVKFMKLNLMDNVYPVKQNFDVIFCCNVFIYFQRSIQEQVINRLLKHLKKGGYFIVGESESIIGMDVRLTTKAPSIYRKM